MRTFKLDLLILLALSVEFYPCFGKVFSYDPNGYQFGISTDYEKSRQTAIDTSIWDKIDLASAKMKPRHKIFPWWIPAVIGGAVGTGTGIYFLTRGVGKKPDGTPPSANDDLFRLSCGQTHIVNPLDNDSGDGIVLVSIAGAPTDLVSIVGNTLRISPLLSGDITFSYTIRDQKGLQANATIQILLEFPPIQTRDLEYEVDEASTWETDILEGQVCQGCSIISASHDPQLQVSWLASGQVTFTTPSLVQPATYTSTFNIRDNCQQLAVIQVLIRVKLKCQIPDPSVNTQAATCTLSDGHVSISLPMQERYRFLWDNGSQSSFHSDVPSGLYRLTISDNQISDCTITLSVEIPAIDLPFNLLDDLYQTDITSTVEGNVLDNDLGTGMKVIEYTPISAAAFSIGENGSFTFTPGNIPAGNYSSIYTVKDTCEEIKSAIIEFEVIRPPCDFTVSYNSTPADCGKPNGSVTLRILPENRQYNITWSNGAIGMSQDDLEAGTLSVTVTDADSMCDEVLSLNIGELPPFEHLIGMQVRGSTCLEDGDIWIEITDKMGGPIQLSLSNEEELILEDQLSAGEYSLQDKISIGPGRYILNLSEGDCPPRCAQTIELYVPEANLDIHLGEDRGRLAKGTSWTGNVLTNDQGVGLKIISHTTPAFGTIQINEDGSTSYQADPDFEGEITIEYTVQDTCGQIATGRLILTIEDQPCIFTADINTTPADCGKNNGSASASILPPGNYFLTWPNGQTGANATDLSPGSYFLTVFNPELNCQLSFPFTIGENAPPAYVQQVSSSPGSCLGNGEINLQLFNQANKPMIVESERNGEPLMTLQLGNGTFQLSQFFNILPGQYTIRVFEMDCPPRCAHVVSIMVDQSNLPMDINDDSYTIPWNSLWEGNVLTNDVGTGLRVITFTPPPTGNANINPDGQGFFLPEQNYFGTVQFTYTVRDTCGQTKTATITIIVEEPPCDYAVTFSVTPASCGLSDGMVVATISPNDPVELNWSNGQFGPVMTDVPAGVYTLTLFNPITNCLQTFVVVVTENDPEFIQSVEVVPSSCNSPGDLIMQLQGSGNFTVLVSGPGGFNTQFNTGNGVTALSQHVDIFPGTWLVIVIDELQGPDCALGFTFTINPYTQFLIELLDIIQPSGPSAQDGAIIVALSGGNPPYTVLVGPNEYSPLNPGTHTLGNLPVGFHEVVGIDATGCFSNGFIVVMNTLLDPGNQKSNLVEWSTLPFAPIYRSQPLRLLHPPLSEQPTFASEIIPVEYIPLIHQQGHIRFVNTSGFYYGFGAMFSQGLIMMQNTTDIRTWYGLAAQILSGWQLDRPKWRASTHSFFSFLQENIQSQNIPLSTPILGLQSHWAWKIDTRLQWVLQTIISKALNNTDKIQLGISSGLVFNLPFK